MRNYLVEALSKYLQILVGLEEKREDYRPDTDAYKNLTGSIFHCEGRVKQIRATLQYLGETEDEDIALEDLTKNQF